MPPYHPADSFQVMVGQPVIASQFDSGFNPELRFTAFAVNMDMHSGFLEREEEKPETALPEYGRGGRRVRPERMKVRRNLWGKSTGSTMRFTKGPGALEFMHFPARSAENAKESSRRFFPIRLWNQFSV